MLAIDQTQLPHRLVTFEIASLTEAVAAIANMRVRGAPLIGVTAAYGLAIALRADAASLDQAAALLCAARPTAVNLRWAVERVVGAVRAAADRAAAAWTLAGAMAEEDVAACRALADHGLPLLQREGTVNVLTHCNAGWLAAIDWGTALAPVYLAAERGQRVHVWVSETRPRNQGAQLTAWELSAAGIDCTVVADNACGWLMQRGMVDVCIVGTDRTTANGDVCNKIGTYLKALAARESRVPFYAAVPTSSIDWRMADWRAIPIEERSEDEVHFVHGALSSGEVGSVRVTPLGCKAKNPAFDTTPAPLLTGLITERGVCRPSELRKLFADLSA